MSTTNFIDGNKFILGANLAWLDDQYDHDFGNNQIMKRSSTPNLTNLKSYLQDMKNMGIQVIRLWVFERFEGMIFDENGFVTLDSTLLENLASACSLANQIGVKFYLCLIDTWGLYYYPDVLMPQKIQNLSAINGLITTEDKTNSYIDKVVLPIITDSRIKDSIFAVDLLNEPEGLKPANVTKVVAANNYPEITWDQIINFIKTCANSIKSADPNLLVSCGFSDTNSIQNDPYGLANSLDFFDFHKYDDNSNLPDFSSLALGKKCIIGECGQATKKWDDELQSEVVCSFLNNALNKGYAGCFVWNYNFKNFDITKKDTDYFQSLINDNGSHRSVCSVINQFSKKI